MDGSACEAGSDSAPSDAKPVDDAARPAPRYWFPAKRYGWGWGLPVTWQGWTTLLAYVASMSVDAVVFPPGTNALAFFAGSALLSAGMVAVCYRKGEPPAWRWGKS